MFFASLNEHGDFPQDSAFSLGQGLLFVSTCTLDSIVGAIRVMAIVGLCQAFDTLAFYMVLRP